MMMMMTAQCNDDGSSDDVTSKLVLQPLFQQNIGEPVGNLLKKPLIYYFH